MRFGFLHANYSGFRAIFVDCCLSGNLRPCLHHDTGYPYKIELSQLNTCLSSEIGLAAFKHAVVRPLPKIPHLDSSGLSNFRPVSHLSFLSKV